VSDKKQTKHMSGLRAFCLALTICSFAIVPAGAYSQGRENLPTVSMSASAQSVQADEMYYDAVRARLRRDDTEAIKLLEQVIKLKPDEGGAYYDLARLNMLHNNIEKATGYIQKAISLNEDNPWYKSQYAEILVSQNKFAEAGDVYSKLAQKERHNDDYLLKAAMLYEHAGKNKEALAEIDKLIAQQGSDNEELLLQKEQMYLKMNNVEGAAAVMETLIKQNPHTGRYYALLAELYATNNENEKAANAFKKAEQMFPDDPEVQLSLANYYKKQKQLDKYHEYAQKAIANKSLDAEQQIAFLIDYMRDLGADTVHLKQAVDVAGQIAQQHENNSLVLGMYGDILSLNGKNTEAVAAYKRSLDIDPSHYAVWQSLLYNYTDRNSADSLLYYTDKALRLFPNQATLHYFKGIAYFNKKDYNPAVKSIDRAIDMSPDDNAAVTAQMYSTLGDIYNLQKNFTAADSSYDKALQLAPDNASYLNNYAYYLSERNTRLSDAEKMSKRSLELRKDEPTFLDTYGWILYREGKYDKAREYVQKAIDANPANADGTLFEHMGDIYYKLNDFDKAVEYWKKAKEKGIDSETIDKKIRDRKLYE